MKLIETEPENDLSGLPLFMKRHVVVPNSGTIPIEGRDYLYNEVTQRAKWLDPTAGNKWSPTAYGDAKVDGVDYLEFYRQ